jgi:PEGA domain
LAVLLLSIHLAFWQHVVSFEEINFMVSVRFSRRLGWMVPVAAMASVCVFTSTNASAQAVAEAAGATSVSGAVTAGAKPAVIPKFPVAAANGMQHLIASAGPPPQETNVREFQAQAGKDAGKVLLRATPTQAQIWVNGKIVGKTPLLLVLAPGKYEVEMRGARGETGKSTVALLPHETRELVVNLHSLYPARVSAPQQ